MKNRWSRQVRVSSRQALLAGVFLLTLPAASWAARETPPPAAANPHHPFNGILRFMAPPSRAERSHHNVVVVRHYPARRPAIRMAHAAGHPAPPGYGRLEYGPDCYPQAYYPRAYYQQPYYPQPVYPVAVYRGYPYGGYGYVYYPSPYGYPRGYRAPGY